MVPLKSQAMISKVGAKVTIEYYMTATTVTVKAK